MGPLCCDGKSLTIRAQGHTSANMSITCQTCDLDWFYGEVDASCIWGFYAESGVPVWSGCHLTCHGNCGYLGLTGRRRL